MQVTGITSNWGLNSMEVYFSLTLRSADRQSRAPVLAVLHGILCHTSEPGPWLLGPLCGWNSGHISQTPGWRKAQRRKGAKGPGQIHLNGIFQTLPKRNSVYMPLAQTSHPSSLIIFQAARCPDKNQGLYCNERWGKRTLEDTLPQSAFTLFIFLFFDFRKEFEEAFRYRVCWLGKIRWTQERVGLVMTREGKRGPCEVWAVQPSGSLCQVLNKFCAPMRLHVSCPSQGCVGKLFVNWTVIMLLRTIAHYLTLGPVLEVEEFMAKNIKETKQDKTGKFMGTCSIE